MYDKKLEKFHKDLDKKIKQDKKERAKKEAKQIYNYNKWKEEHDQLINDELDRLNKRNKANPVLKALVVITILVLMFYQPISEFIAKLILLYQ